MSLAGSPTPNPRQDAADEEIRCGCKSLLARRVEGGIELKCRRCRSRLLLTLGSDGSVQVVERKGEP